ncbi:MAG: threonyl-tRNA synthetase [Halanaerobiales bacterium]|nr:threonyl-tRNA synthetase [Halanaerobiales bacterium]
MAEIKITLPDGSEKCFESGITVEEVAYSIGKGLGRVAVAGKVNGELVDLKTNLDSDAEVAIITLDSEEGLDIYRHTTAHIMAQAVKRLFAGVKLAIGPTIEDGFYYDFDLEKRFSPEDLEEIEAEMQKIIKEDYPIKRELVKKEEAIRLMEEKGEAYKVELIREFDDDYVSLYHQGEFTDLCRGPHLPSTGRVKAYKLLSVAGAYWRGDENNKMLQRIYGTAFVKKSELDDYLHRLEEAKKRDHRKIGKELDLFSFHEEAPGFPFFHPKGMIIWNQLIDFWRKVHRENGYQEIKTPLILNRRLWLQSGHWEHYKENMYFTKIDEEDYAIKPMNCPGGVLVYKNDMHSYREFPIRTAELGYVHRHERSGTLHGLMRVRAFTQDDAHIFMLPEQIKDELLGVLKLVDDFYQVFGFNYHVELSTRPEKSMGSDEDWERAINALKEALAELDLDYEINEGDGAFYGPKIDVHIEDSLGRTWQCATIQLDFQMPERFDLTYVGTDGQEHRPVMIHRVIMGSIERFIGILIEHFAGAFPVWLAPVQVEIIPVSDDQLDYANQVKRALEEEEVRVEIDDSQEKVGYKIRQAQVQQIPYMLIIGPREVEENNVSVRERRKGDLGAIKLDEFKNRILTEIAEKKY